MLIPTSPGYELDPSLQGVAGRLRLPLPSAGPQPFCSGQLAKPATLSCSITSGGRFPQPSQQKCKPLDSALPSRSLSISIIDFGLSSSSAPFLPSSQHPFKATGNFRLTTLKAYHQPNAIPGFLCLSEGRTGQLRMTKA